jgi:hypothetical protein
MKKEIISMLLGDIGLVSDKDKFRSDRYPEFHVCVRSGFAVFSRQCNLEYVPSANSKDRLKIINLFRHNLDVSQNNFTRLFP